MITASQGLIEAIYNDSIRNYDISVTIYERGTPKSENPPTPIVTITNDGIWQNGVVIESSASGENEVTIGKCIVRKLALTLVRTATIDGIDFVNKWLNISMGYNGTMTDFGWFKVDEQAEDDLTLTLTCYDSLCRLDARFSGVTYPITAYDLLSSIPTMIGWGESTDLFILTSEQETEFRGTTLPFVPADEDLTCREIMEYLLQIMGYNMNAVGMHYRFSTLDFGIVDGVTPTDEYTAQTNGYNLFRYLFSLSIDRQDIQISGVEVVYNDPSAPTLVNEEYNYIPEVFNPIPYFTYRVENNPLVTPDNAGYVRAALFSKYGGIIYRKASFTHIEDPRIEAGDIGLLIDRNGDYHPIVVSHTRFQIQNRQTSYCGANPPFRSNARGYSQKTRTVKEAYYLSKVHSDANASSIAELQGEGLWQTQTCTYAYTCAASGSANVTKANLGVSVPTGYKIAGYTSISTANADVVPRSWNSNSTTTGTSIVLRNLTNTQKTGTLTVVVLYLKTSHEAT